MEKFVVRKEIIEGKEGEQPLLGEEGREGVISLLDPLARLYYDADPLGVCIGSQAGGSLHHYKELYRGTISVCAILLLSIPQLLKVCVLFILWDAC